MHVTVISGTLNFGIGESFDESKTTALKGGGYAQAALVKASVYPPD